MSGKVTNDLDWHQNAGNVLIKVFTTERIVAREPFSVREHNRIKGDVGGKLLEVDSSAEGGGEVCRLPAHREHIPVPGAEEIGCAFSNTPRTTSDEDVFSHL